MSPSNNEYQRKAGILLHITSLPSPYKSGTMGRAAYQFVDFLKESGQKLWQILPFGIPDKTGSPYSGLSSFGGNSLFISPYLLMRNFSLLTQKELDEISDHRKLLELSFTRFDRDNEEFLKFKTSHQSWLFDLSLFLALTIKHGSSWNKWPQDLAQRKSAALDQAANELSETIEFEMFLQYCFARQWHDLKAYSNSAGVQLVGDLPIFVGHHSMEVWKYPQYFKLDDDFDLLVETGVPPDDFSTAGQKWGTPNYNWDELKKDHFSLWVDRIQFLQEHVSIVRIDHFLGLVNIWEVPIDSPNGAIGGAWSKTPGRELLTILNKNFPQLEFIAEDLGKINDDVIKLREDFSLPSMKILQFAYGSDESNEHLPQNVCINSVIFTGTHDNDTIIGWYNGLTDDEILNIKKLSGLDLMGGEVHWQFINICLQSISRMCIIPLQDILGLDSSFRMNIPGTIGNNWKYRFNLEQITPAITKKLYSSTKRSER